MYLNNIKRKFKRKYFFFFYKKMMDANVEWLEDVALKLLCVFALDRFGDYVSDEVFISKNSLTDQQ